MWCIHSTVLAVNSILLTAFILFAAMSLLGHRMNACAGVLFHDKFFHCSTTRMDEDTRFNNSKYLIPVNQPPHLTKDSFAWIVLNYVILSVLDVNNIF